MYSEEEKTGKTGKRREEKNDCGKREVPHFRFQEEMNFVDLNGAAGQRVSRKPTSEFIDPLYGRQ